LDEDERCAAINALRAALADESTPVTGWTDGLSQDYNRKLAKWFMNKPGAMQELRSQFEPTGERAELIARLRDPSGADHMLFDDAADMLEADTKPEPVEETHCPHGRIIADWCPECFSEIEAYFHEMR
jgi:hypothetical protein